jgi:hypothetical protein
MQTNALEEAPLTEPADEPQPETTDIPARELPEAPDPETTALAPTEPDVIEGEFVEIEPPGSSENYPPPKQTPYWLLIPFTVVLCLLFVAGSLLLPVLSPSATITLVPVEQNMSLTRAIQVQGRQLAPLTLALCASVQATGKKHQDAARAAGTITFYNGLLLSQTIAAGTVLTGNDGVQVITDQAALIPAGNPPIYGQVTVAAHAVLAGPQGNIPAYDINTACCATSVVAKNTRSFSGGADARDYSVVTRTDINTAVTSLLITLSQSEDAALSPQLHEGEALITPSCNPEVSSDHRLGDEAKHVAVTVSVTCSGIAYVARTAYALAAQLLASDVTRKLGSRYALVGGIQVTIVHATMKSPGQRQATLLVQAAGTLAYQITQDMQQRLLRLIAGMTAQQAEQTLLTIPGIAGAQISVKGGNRTLPQDPRNITIIVVYRQLSY